MTRTICDGWKLDGTGNHGMGSTLFTVITKQTLFRAMEIALALCMWTTAAGAQRLPQVNRSHSFEPDQCGPADPVYIKTANETGGVPLFLQRNEAGKAMQLMLESTRENVSTVLWASAKVAGPQKFEIPIDSATERITFTFSVDTKGTRLVLREPNGQEVGASSPGIKDTGLNCGRLITIVKPQPGIWHAEINGSGTFWLEAQALSDIYLLKAEFVEVGERIGHEGLFRIQGQPIAGRLATLQVSFSAGQTRTAEVALVSARGDVLEKLHLKTTDPDREFLELTGDVTLPNEPFRIAVTGRDAKGMLYQRFNSPLFHAETVEVIPRLAFDEIAPGSAQTAQFELKNFGPARTFKVTVTDAHKFVAGVQPKELSVPANGTGNLKLQLSVPAGTQPGTGDDLVVVVASTSGPPTTNSAIVHLSVATRSAAETAR
jgi:von Willebrand factor A domain-containing protein 7